EVLVFGETAGGRGEADRFDEPRAQERRVQPVQVVRGGFQDFQVEPGRGAEDFHERELFPRSTGLEGGDRQALDAALDRAERELQRREFRDLPLLEEFAEAHVSPPRGAGGPSTSCRTSEFLRRPPRGSRTRPACRSSSPW